GGRGARWSSPEQSAARTPFFCQGPPTGWPCRSPQEGGRTGRGGGRHEGGGTREKKKKKKKEKAVPPNCQRLTVNNSAPGHGEAQMPLGHSKAGRRSRYTDQGSAHVARGS
ncbi:unnamed protein product, partial [Prorocentrum cordatum]